MYRGATRGEKFDGLILSRRDVGESDRLITLFTKEHGLVRAFANGVRKIPSRRGGHTEPMTRVVGQISGSASRYNISSIETQDYYKELHGDVDALERAGFLSQLVVGLFEEQDFHSGLFGLLEMGWQGFPGLDETKRSLLEVAVLWQIVDMAGFLPRLDSCQVCGLASPAELAVLGVGNGGWRCESCVLGGGGIRVDARALIAIRFMSKYPDRAVKISVSEEEASKFAVILKSYCRELLWMHQSVFFDGAKAS